MRLLNSSPLQSKDSWPGAAGGPATKVQPQVVASLAHTKTWRMSLDDTSPNDEPELRPPRFGGRKLVAAAVAVSLMGGWVLFSNWQAIVVPPVEDRESVAALLRHAEEHVATANQLLKTEQVPQLTEVLEETNKADQLLRDVAEHKPDAASRRQTNDLHRQSLLLKIRARSRQLEPDRAELQREVEELSSLLSASTVGNAVVPLSRRALEPLLVLICSSGGPHDDYSRSLRLLAKTWQSLEAAGQTTDDWTATATERASLDDVKGRVAGQVFEVLDGLKDRPNEALKLCEDSTIALQSDPWLLYRKARLEIVANKFTEAAESLRQVVGQTAVPAPPRLPNC